MVNFHQGPVIKKNAMLKKNLQNVHESGG